MSTGNYIYTNAPINLSAHLSIFSGFAHAALNACTAYRQRKERRGQRSYSGRDRRRRVPHGIFLLSGLPLHVLNTTAGPTLLHTTVQQIPGKYELVSTCTAQTNTGLVFLFFPLSSFHFYSINTSKQHLFLLSGKKNLIEAEVQKGYSLVKIITEVKI